MDSAILFIAYEHPAGLVRVMSERDDHYVDVQIPDPDKPGAWRTARQFHEISDDWAYTNAIQFAKELVS